MSGKQEKLPHCLVLPFPLQGHVNPMLQFSKRLRSQGLTRISLVLFNSFHKTLQDFPPTFSFPVESITDGLDDGLKEQMNEEMLKRAREVSSESLGQLLEKLRSSGSGADWLVYDAFFPWVPDVAKDFGVTTAPFFTQSNSVNSIYFHAHKEDLQAQMLLSDAEIRIPGGLPVLKHTDLPSFIRDYESDPLSFEILKKQFMNVEKVKWIFVNSFYELEHEVCDWMGKIMPVRPIGPTIPSAYTDKRIPDDKEYGLSAFRPITDACMNWLDKCDVGSVIYVSFGSFAKPRVEQFEAVALALQIIDMKFLWVVRASEESKLPQNFKEETSGKGQVVMWCNQLDVLAHEAVGCFVTHCGWNSTLEALTSGVPMVAVPQWSDQFTNAKCVADVWRVGIRAEEDEKGVVRKEEVVRCIKRVMEGETGEDIKTSADKWKKMAKEAVDEGGSSDNNIQEFVGALLGAY